MSPAAVSRLISWLAARPRSDDKFLRHQHRLLVIIGLITFLFALLYVAVSQAIGFQVGVALMLACAVLLLATLAVFRSFGQYRLCANLYLANCFFVAVLGCSFFSGGIHSMVTPWFVLVPVTSVLLLENSRDTVIWTLMTCAAIAGYGLSSMLGVELPSLYDGRFRDFFDTVCITGLAIILSWIAFMFGRNRNQAMATIHEQKESLQNALAEIEQMAYHDALTQLPNRRLFMDRLGQALADNKRNGRYAALMFLDLDNFKTLNDSHGHEAGDLLLVQAAQRLVHCMREIDTVARFGGDEFAVILSSLGADLDGATARAKIVAEKISATLAEPYVIAPLARDSTAAPTTHKCTASIGVVLFLNHDYGQRELLVWADAAMYRAKLAGKGSIVFHAAGSAVPAEAAGSPAH